MSTPIYDRCLADFAARHGHAPGQGTRTDYALQSLRQSVAKIAPVKKAAPRKAAAKKTTTRRKR